MPKALDLQFSLLFHAIVSVLKSVILCFSSAGCTTRPATETNLPNSRTHADVRPQEAARTRLWTHPGTGTACNIFTCGYLLKTLPTRSCYYSINKFYQQYHISTNMGENIMPKFSGSAFILRNSLIWQKVLLKSHIWCFFHPVVISKALVHPCVCQWVSSGVFQAAQDWEAQFTGVPSSSNAYFR